MKKKLLICLCACAAQLLLGAGASLAATGAANNGSGGKLTMGTFTFNSSPSVSIVAFDTDNAYALETTNVLTTGSESTSPNGLIYAANNLSTGYAQKTKDIATNTALTALSSATPDFTTGFTWFGGNGS